jgi:hypothetical protein
MDWRGGHNHKFDKIKHILEFYPSLKYVLIEMTHDPFFIWSHKQDIPYDCESSLHKANRKIKKIR